MRVIVLGASGQIGSIIYDGLKERHHVTGTSRKRRADLIQFDPFRDDWTVLGKADVLINCVGQIESTNTSSFHHIHVELTKRIIERRQEVGTPAIIQISALGASAKHQVEFLRTKGLADDLLLQHPDTAVVRPSIVCTHRTMIVKKMIMLFNLSRLFFGVVPVPQGFLQTRIQPVMPEDLVDLVEKMCFDRSQRIIHAVGSEPISFREIIQIMTESKHRRLRIIQVPKPMADVIVKDLVSRIIPKVISSQQYELLFQDNVADAGMAEQILDRQLKSTREFFKNEFTYAND